MQVDRCGSEGSTPPFRTRDLYSLHGRTRPLYRGSNCGGRDGGLTEAIQDVLYIYGIYILFYERQINKSLDVKFPVTILRKIYKNV